MQSPDDKGLFEQRGRTENIKSQNSDMCEMRSMQKIEEDFVRLDQQ